MSIHDDDRDGPGPAAPDAPDAPTVEALGSPSKALETVETEILGRDVMPGHWTYQIVDAYDETYYEPFRELERTAVSALAGGHEHCFEARLQRERRTPGHPDHAPAEGADT